MTGSGHEDDAGHGRDHSHDDGDARGDGAGRSATEATETATLRLTVPDMDCASCAGKVRTALEGQAGVVTVDPRPTTGTVAVGYDPDRTDVATLVGAVEGVGYAVTGRRTPDGDGDGASATGDGETPASDTDTDTGGGVAAAGAVWTGPRAVKTGLGAVALAIGLVLAFLVPAWNPVVVATGTVGPGAGLAVTLRAADVAFLVAVAVPGQTILRNGYYSARARTLDIDFLMSAAILGALLASLVFDEALYFEAATLAVLFSVAELLERYAMDRARTSLRSLLDLSPDEATVRRDGTEVTVPVDAVAVGDVVVVRPGERLPRDGTVIDGESAVNQAPITGESVPVDKTVGDPVYAGTITETGYLAVEVTAAAGRDTLSRIVELIEDAQANRTDREQFVERFAAGYTPVVVAAAVLVTVASPVVLGTAWPTAVVYGLTLLVLACPCAFVISTPVSVVSGLTSAAKNGVLIKGGDHLEAMGAVDVIAFDKTGTLTTGELTVTDVIPLNGNSESEVLACARGVERRSEHPIGEAIVAAGDGTTATTTATAEAGSDAGAGAEAEITDFESLTGKGVRAEVDGTPHLAGKPGLFEELGVDLTHVHATTDGGQVTRTARTLCDRNDCLDLLEDTVPRLQAEGKTVVLVGTEAELEGVIAVADTVRPAAARTIARLRERGVRTVMLTGDNERTARAVAEEVGVDEYHADLLPEEKVDAIASLVDETDGVAMVGDGINDAPALATATVGIAMGAVGTDTAIETADIALLGDDLTKLPYLHELAGRADGVIRQNVWASLAVKAALAVGVPFGLVPIWLAVLAGDAGMTTAVTANAMRLSRLRPDAG